MAAILAIILFLLAFGIMRNRKKFVPEITRDIAYDVESGQRISCIACHQAVENLN